MVTAKKLETDPLKWINDYEAYINAHRTKVFNEKTASVLQENASSKESALIVLEKIGYLASDGSVATRYFAKSVRNI